MWSGSSLFRSSISLALVGALASTPACGDDSSSGSSHADKGGSGGSAGSAGAAPSGSGGGPRGGAAGTGEAGANAGSAGLGDSGEGGGSGDDAGGEGGEGSGGEGGQSGTGVGGMSAMGGMSAGAGAGAVAGGGTGGVGGAGGAGAGGAGAGGAGAGGAGASGAGAGGNAGGGGAGGGNSSSVLLAALNGTTWRGMHARSAVTRAVELRFDSVGLRWGELVNPFGPARFREMKQFSVRADGRTVDTQIVVPTGFPPNPNAGQQTVYELEIVAGTPDTLRVTGPLGTESYERGGWPAPTDGLTATARVFSTDGPVANALCLSGFSGIDYGTLLNFARGAGSEQPLGVDRVAGARLLGWRDGTGTNDFAVADVPGFADLGGTTLSAAANFVVHYTGTVEHPGGTLSLRELDDSVTDALWVFLGTGVGSSNPNDLFLEVQGVSLAPDRTSDAPSANFAASNVPIEVIIVRCASAIEDIDAQLRFGAQAYQLVGNAPSDPLLNDTLFPPLF